MNLAFDQIGNVAILEVPEERKKEAKQLAAKIMDTNKHITSVYAKGSAMAGKYRVRKLKFLAGEKSTLTTYKESGCVFELDVAKVYFSPRLAFERTRISNEVKNGEKILALFAGVGPFPIVIAKKLKTEKKTAEIVANELNPAAVKYLRQNIKLNKVEEFVTADKGDAAKLLVKKKKWASRVIMPLPHTAEQFLPQVIDATAKNGIVHFYGFGPHRNEKTKKAADPFKKLEAKIKALCKKKKRTCKIIFKRVVRPYSPFSVQVVIDFKVL
ncbi:MAG: class I SAM-dependent methyltransferase family protein [Candidatus Micrarchaeota archaeon]|nr:class I SAM-dependent methyltransferase family protein [Candidatus Micrarchaeota archaeon]